MPGISENERSKHRLLVSLCLITSFFSLLYVSVSLAIGFNAGAVSESLLFVGFYVILLLFRARGGFRLCANLYIAGCASAIIACSYFSGGLFSPVTPWFAMIPIGSILLIGCRRDSVAWGSACALIVLAYGVAESAGYRFPAEYRTEYARSFATICLLGLLMIVFAVSLAFDVMRSNVLQELAGRDGLTGIPNRRLFDETLRRELVRHQRSGQPFSLALMDIDFFKQYNDCYGHAAGDAVLKAVALRLTQRLRRPADFVARYGGEEFAMVLPETDAAGAREVSEVIRASIEALLLPHEKSKAASTITLSVGGVTVLEGAASPCEVVELADKGLYAAKQQGRNRVVWHSAAVERVVAPVLLTAESTSAS